MNTPDLLPLLIPATLQWILYTALSWLLLKVQRVKCNGLLPVVAALAVAAATFVPVYGLWVSFAVLLLLLPLATRKARLLPHLVFTVVVSGGIIFALNTWVLPSVVLELEARAQQWIEVAAAGLDKTAPAEASEDPEPDTSVVDTNAPPPEPPPIAQVWQHETGLSVRGISYSKTRPLAMVALDEQVLTLGVGESLSIETKNGSVRARCIAIERSYIRVQFESGETVDLLLD